MKVLVTGATGFLGSHLTKALFKAEHDVAILKRSFSNISRIESIIDKIAVYDLDKCDLSQPFKDFGRFDTVIHMATCYGRNGERIQDIFKANTLFPLKILEVATNFNTATFFNTDTILSKYLNEYALSKSQFKEWGYLYAGADRIRFINIKLEHIYGPGDDNSKFVTHVIKSCLKNIPELKLTLGEQKRDFIYIDDVVAAYRILLENVLSQPGSYQEYEVGSGIPVTIRQLVECVHEATNSSTILQFGAIPYRENEVMESFANTAAMNMLGWKAKVDLFAGLESVIRKEQFE